MHASGFMSLSPSCCAGFSPLVSCTVCHFRCLVAVQRWFCRHLESIPSPTTSSLSRHLAAPVQVAEWDCRVLCTSLGTRPSQRCGSSVRPTASSPPGSPWPHSASLHVNARATDCNVGPDGAAALAETRTLTALCMQRAEPSLPTVPCTARSPIHALVQVTPSLTPARRPCRVPQPSPAWT